jgi:hypothetical protein
LNFESRISDHESRISNDPSGLPYQRYGICVNQAVIKM